MSDRPDPQLNYTRILRQHHHLAEITPQNLRIYVIRLQLLVDIFAILLENFVGGDVILYQHVVCAQDRLRYSNCMGLRFGWTVWVLRA